MSKAVNSKTKRLIFSALFVAVICVISQIYIPAFSVPVTLQVFAVSICGYFLGAKHSVLSVAVYIILGVIGFPVFHGFQGGAHHFFNLTGGFILGFLPLAFCCGISLKFKNNAIKILFGIIGVLLCHTFGVLQFSIVSSNNIIASFAIASLPYLLKDIPLCVLAFYISRIINKKINS